MISQHQIIISGAIHQFVSQHQIIINIRRAIHHFVHHLRLPLGDVFKNEVPQHHEIGPERGPGGSVWAETLSK